jgi:hypothetical protein
MDRAHSGGLRAIFTLEGAKEEDGPQVTGHRSPDDFKTRIRLDVSETVKQLDEVSARLRDEFHSRVASS